MKIETIILLLLILVGVIYVPYQGYQDYNNDIKFDRMIGKIQDLASNMTFNQKRSRTILGIRDYVRKYNTDLSVEDSYEIAEIDMEMSERYDVPVSWIVAIQKHESGFDKSALSVSGAMGINQIMPTTGRLLCGRIGWEYDRRIFFSARNNTILAASLLNVLRTEHKGELKPVLAEYNGGTLMGYLAKNKEDLLFKETKEYIENVKNSIEFLESYLKNYPMGEQV